MTVIKRYSENKELIAEDKPVNAGNVEQYIAQYGAERAQGYLQALTDVEADLVNLIWKKLAGNENIFSSKTISSAQMMQFHDQKVDLIEKLKLMGIKLPEPKDNLNY